MVPGTEVGYAATRLKAPTSPTASATRVSPKAYSVQNCTMRLCEHDSFLSTEATAVTSAKIISMLLPGYTGPDGGPCRECTLNEFCARCHLATSASRNYDASY
eukprot:614964-Rhodomonas_salina.1